MSRRDIIVLVFALVCAAGGFVLMINYLNATAKKNAPTYRYVIALTPFSIGQEIKEKDVAISNPVHDGNVNNYFMHPADLVGYEAAEDIHKDSLIKRSSVRRIPPPPPAPPPAPVIIKKKAEPLPMPSGMRGFSMKSTEVENFSDAIKMGSYVDVLGAGEAETSGGMIPIAARGCQVLFTDPDAVDQDRTVMLAVRARELEPLRKVIREGKVRFIVRGDAGRPLSLNYTEIIRGISKERVVQSGDGEGQAS